MISRVANLRVRSVGTLGGNLCLADPHSDPAPGPDGEASPDYLRHLVAVHARQALDEAFSAS
jgi:hypothetical protein